MLKIYVYGYINQIASSRRLEREAQRNVEMMWLTGRPGTRPSITPSLTITKSASS
jgi:transposase